MGAAAIAAKSKVTLHVHCELQLVHTAQPLLPAFAAPTPKSGNNAFFREGVAAFGNPGG
jgi:hypothetical protein